MDTTDPHLWHQLVAWLHGLGLHLGTGVVGQVGEQVGAGVSDVAAPAKGSGMPDGAPP